MQQMMHATHSKLGIKATAVQQKLTKNELVDTLDNLAKSATFKNDMVET